MAHFEEAPTIPSADVGALIQPPSAPDRFQEIALNLIDPDPDQPRKTFHESKTRQLAESIKSVGLLQPIVVRKSGARYTLVAGERRLRAVTMLGEETVKAIVRSNDDPHTIRLLQLVENEEREALDPIEIAQAVRRDIEQTGIKKEVLAAQLAWSRQKLSEYLTVSRAPSYVHHFGKEFFISVPKTDENGAAQLGEDGRPVKHESRRPPLSFIHLTLLARFDKAIKKADVERKKIDGGAKTLNAERLVRRLGEKSSLEDWSRKKLDAAIKAKLASIATANEESDQVETARPGETQNERALRLKLQRMLGTKVDLKHQSGRGSFRVHFGSYEELDAILARMQNPQ